MKTLLLCENKKGRHWCWNTESGRGKIMRYRCGNTENRQKGCSYMIAERRGKVKEEEYGAGT
ncbi:MAG: hypothetical protein J1E34_08840 [Oscillospiraceae bacterium]|nr:hypothetical protein [Oscillospiraceae bacterium]